MFSEPVLKDFEKRTGIQVRIVGDTEATKTTGLVNRLIQMKNKPEADVFWNNEVMNSVRLANMGLLEPYAPAGAEDIPAAFRDPEKRWVGFAARARVILYNTDLVKPEEAPKSIFDLTQPRYKGRVAIAKPLFGTTSTHVAALFAALGAEKVKQWLVDLKANDVRIVVGNAFARNLVMNGEIAICLTDTDDANGAFLKNKPVEMVYPDADGIGTLVIPNTVMLIKNAPHPDAGRKLVDYLASRSVEERLAKLESAQMPLRDGISPYSERFDLSKINAMRADWMKAAEIVPESTKFVQETFLR
ncbi:MAG: extracellular solute-binding protein [Planctomycetes bacterium]|nr:extracellular solute-binding protein [Planctomycetota bacterium]